MASGETQIVHDCMVAASKLGSTVFKNVRGVFISPNGAHRVAAGLLFPGSGDLIGWTPVVITPEMVGRTVAVFTAFECKTAKGRATPEQQRFIELVRRGGGIAGVTRCADDAETLIKQIDKK